MLFIRLRGGEIFRSSHALIDDFSDIKTDAITANKLFKKLKGNKKALVFAHVGGRYANLDMHTDEIEKAIEIHSCWGTFEWFLQDALIKGCKIGIVANSDGHKGRVGAEYPGATHFGSYGGLTCVLASDLSRESIFNALLKRHTYATTGARIYLNVDCEVGAKRIIMGDSLKVKNEKIKFKVECVGTGTVERIEIWNKDRVVHRNYPEFEGKGGCIKIIWKGSRARGRAREAIWNGELKIGKDNKFEKIEKINFYNDNHRVIFSKNKRLVSWNGSTTGGVQGLILGLKSSKGFLSLNLNERLFCFKIDEISQKPRTYTMGGLDLGLEIYKTLESDRGNGMKFEFEVDKINKGENPFFVKVIQRNGHIAWSSPIYLNYS